MNNCDVCGKSTVTKSTGHYYLTNIGMRVTVDEDHPEYADFMQMFGKKELQICLCCVALGAGVKPKMKDVPTVSELASGASQGKPGAA